MTIYTMICWALIVCGIFIIFIVLFAIRKPDDNNLMKNYWEGFFKRSLK